MAQNRKPGIEPNINSVQFDGLVAWYPSSPAGGGSLYDLAQGATGNLQTFHDIEAAWVTDPIREGYVLEYDGVKAHVDCGDSHKVDGDQITMMAWVKMDSVPDIDGNVIFKEDEYQISVNSSGVFWWSINYSGSSATNLTTYTIPLNTWVHLAVSYDGKSVKAYANGVEVDSDLTSIGNIATGINSLYIGDLWKGRIDDVRIYNRGLTAPEIEKVWNPQTRWDLWNPQHDPAILSSNEVFDEGGVTAGAEADISVLSDVVLSGGLLVGGTSPVQYTANEDASGGLLSGGISISSLAINEGVSGGLLSGGTSPIQHIANEDASDGMLVGGTSVDDFVDVIDVTGGGSTNGVSAVQYTANEDVSGGLLSGGASTISIAINEDVSGGLLSGETSPVQYTTNEDTSGGLLSGGTSAVQYTANEDMSGGLLSGGTSPIQHIANEDASGGLLFGGTSVDDFVDVIDVTGGGFANGTSPVQYTANEDMSGGLLVGGTSPVQYTANEDMSGGLLSGGTSTISLVANEDVSGGLLSGGTSLFAVAVSEYVFGGLLSGGTSPVQYTANEDVSGGLLSGGTSTIQYTANEDMSGGLLSGGTSTISLVANEDVSGVLLSGGTSVDDFVDVIDVTGGGFANGTSPVQYTANEDMSGGMLSGETSTISIVVNEDMSGGLLSGETSTISLAINEDVSGGLLSGGTSSFAVAVSEYVFGGGFANGTSAVQYTANEDASGGLLSGGTSTIQYTANEDMSGGLLSGGTSTISLAINEDVSGGLLFGGTSSFAVTVSEYVFGGGFANGESTIQYTANEDMSSGLLSGRTSTIQYTANEDMSGGLLSGGTSTISIVANEDVSGGLLSGGTSTISIVTNEDVSGGLLSGGTSVDDFVDVIDVSGGGSTNGTSPVQYTANEDMSGGLLSGGTSTFSLAINKGVSGGLLSGGTSPIQHTANEGGVKSNGVATVTIIYNVETVGGLISNGEGLRSLVAYLESVGGANAGGEEDGSYSINIDMSGGLLSGGLSPHQHIATEIGSGILAAGGSAANQQGAVEYPMGGGSGGGSGSSSISDIIEIDEAGVISGGSADVASFIQPVGGSTSGGSSQLGFSVNVKGGLVAGGTHQQVFIDAFESSGGIEWNGESNVSQTRVLFHESTGGVDLEGGLDSESGVSNLSFIARGGISVNNGLSPSVTNTKFTIVKDFLWRLRSFTVKDLTFLWSTGQLGIFFYRVIGKARQGDECNLKADPCCQKFILNIHARTVAELCEKISERNFILPIESVQRFSRPAALSNIFDDSVAQQDLIDEYDAINGDCEELIDVEFCDVPQCADFCVDFDLRVSFKLKTILQKDSFLQYESGGFLAFNRKMSVSGSAEVVLVRNLPHFPYTSSGGLEVGYEAGYLTNIFRGRGGIKLAGSAINGFSGWKYCAGQWPLYSNEGIDGTGNRIQIFNNATDIITVNDLDGDDVDLNQGQADWQQIERVLEDDDLFSQVDISFGKKSTYLIARKFKLRLPADADVFGVQVGVSLLADQVNIRDLDVVIVRGTKRLSYNLSAPSVDWALIKTERLYGSDGFTSHIPFQSPDGDWNVDDLNSDEFGLAIRVRDAFSTSGSIAKIDQIKMKVTYQHAENQILKTGGTAKVVSSVFSYSGSGGLEPKSDHDIKAGFSHYSFGLGTGQPTAFLIGGSYETGFSYTSDDSHIEWENDSTIDVSNIFSDASWPDTSSNQLKSEIIGGSPIAGVSWASHDRATIADASSLSSSSYAVAPVDGASAASEFLVLRGWDFNLPDHVRVHGLKVVVANRFAENLLSPGVTDVRDDYLYLVKGDTIISGNLAKTGDKWPELPSSLFYGSTGFDEEVPFMDLETNPLTPDDINDPEFGVAIAVSNFDDTFGTKAKIDGIGMELTLEANGRIVVVVSEPKIGGSADAIASFTNFISDVSVVVGGGADVKPFWESGNGGVINSSPNALENLLKSPNENVVYSHISTGGATASGLADVPLGVFGYVSSGGLSTNGFAKFKRDNWSFVSDGNAIFIGGTSSYLPADLGTLTTTMQFGMNILQTNAKFAEDIDQRDAEGLSGNITQCGCLALPLSIEFGHNFARDNIFAKFLARNNFTISRVLNMRYNVPNDSWQANLHYRGLSADANTEEKWDLIFELQCTNNMGGINIGRRIWKVAMDVFRKNLNTLEDFDTRVIVGILPEPLCDVNANELDFKVTYDTFLGFADVSPEATIYQSSIFDNIGLFKNRSWTESPDLILSVSQSGLAEEQVRVDLTDQVFQ